MKEGTAIEIAKSKMKELGVGDDYLIRYRHLQLDSKEQKKIKGENHLYFYVDLNPDLKIESKAGIYNLSDDGINEQQYVHRGLIQLENLSKKRIDVKFIQVIPLHEKAQEKTEQKQDLKN